MDLTTYGYKIPKTPDTGQTWFSNLEFDIQRLNDHSHNGVDSTLLATNAVTVTTQAIASASWGSDLGGGTYKQSITLPSVGATPAQLLFNAIGIEIRVTSTKEVVYPKIIRTGASTYDIYTNDNTQAFTALYTS